MTAYEILISCWSSDVCSSDLRQRARVGQADVFDRHPGQAPGEVVRVAAAVEHAREPVQRSVGVGAAHRLVQRRDLVVELLATLVEAAGTVGQHLFEDRVGDHAAALPFNLLASKLRSEEHTSELQSLMRISYAVFCLKT